MRNFYLLFCFLFISTISFAQEPFITTWEVAGDDLEITIPTVGTGYNYTIDFGDGTVQTNVTGNITHTYSIQGIYTVSISGDFPRIYLVSAVSNYKIRSIEQWGDIEWTSMQGAFQGCDYLTINATDVPNLSQVTDMSSMFYGSSFFNANESIGNWDVSNVTNMIFMFREAQSFNQSLDNWDVSNVTNMNSMFYNAISFNQSINSWDVSNVINMDNMFRNALSFNQTLNNWNVSGLTNMSYMFNGASSFNGVIDNWDVSNVTNMSYMFDGATSFNQLLNNWDVSNVINMSYMFNEASSFNGAIGNWDVSNVANMTSMFNGASSFNGAIGNWDVSNVTKMNSMFYGASSFNGAIGNWDVSNVNNMSSMFRFASSFNQSLNNWDVSNITNMTSMFHNASSFNQSINDWDVSNVTNMSNMFKYAFNFNQPLNYWDVSNVSNMSDMFFNASLFNQSLNNWDFSNLSSSGLGNFLNYCGMNVTNYDSLLSRFLNLGMQGYSLGANGLEYCNEIVRHSLINGLDWNITGDSLAENCNTISGFVLYDSDINGCTTTDISGGFFVNLNNDTNDYAKSVTNGSYNISIIEETYTVSLTNVPDYFTVNPISASVDFATTTNEQVDFCLTANQSVNDLNITLLPLDDARPGFESNYRLVVENVGTQAISNITANLTFDDTKQSFVSSLPSNTSSSANTIEFSISSLDPFQKQEIDIVMQTFTPPTVNGDDVLSFVATVLPDTSDYTPNDNTYTFDQIVVNSFDPNDKRVLQGDFITIDETDEYLDYIIRFQNTGTANATFVRIEDVLDADLDWSTLKITNASHAYQVTVSNGNEVEFKFDNINLPYEAMDEEGSNGFVAYKIKPKSTIQLGDIMSGDASIFFDFNLPIITNSVSTEVVNPLSTDEFNFENLVTVYPNPSNHGFFIKVKNGVNVASFQIYNLQGSKLLDFSNNSEYVDTKSLISGVYFLVINTDRGNVTEKIIIN